MSQKPAESFRQPQFYQKVVALSDKGHADWHLQTENNFKYAEKANAVLITAIEFSLVAAEYPIVFVAQNDDIQPVALLGLKPEQNLYINDKFEWDAGYIPAYVRRYPFILAGDQNKVDTTYTVCIDESFPGFNRKSGEPLFADSGQFSPYLERVIAFLKDYQAQGQATAAFCKKLKKLDLLEPMQANISSVKEEDFSVAGFMVLNTDRLKALKPLEVMDLVKTDEMGLIYQHISSMGNFKKLTDRYTSRQPA